MKSKLHILFLACVTPLLILISATGPSNGISASEAWASGVPTPAGPPTLPPNPRNVVVAPPVCPTAAAGKPPTYCQKPAKVIKIQ